MSYVIRAERGTSGELHQRVRGAVAEVRPTYRTRGRALVRPGRRYHRAFPVCS